MSRPLPKFAQPEPARSANMRAIRASGNRSTEWRLRSFLIRRGIKGWTLHSKEVVGNPDFYFPKHQLIIFIDGCYWHGCPKCGHIPKTNTLYWTAKIGLNKKRDRRYVRELRKQGFKVIRIWECALKRQPERCLQRILARLAQESE